MSDLIRDLSKPLEITPTGTEARLPILKGIQHLVFDVYGTLLISGAGAPPLSPRAGKNTAPIYLGIQFGHTP
ncbi:hypothetical protein N9051_02680 [Akkermansiaceae bacterium]|nr:hypothetical protein [Akkermansiaceae bacterium]